jgi:hypothetical protein
VVERQCAGINFGAPSMAAWGKMRRPAGWVYPRPKRTKSGHTFSSVDFPKQTTTNTFDI